MKKEKNLRPVLFFTLIGIILVSALLFVISLLTERVTPPVSINNNPVISRLEYWEDAHGTVAKDILYEEDQNIYTSSYMGEYKNYGINPKVSKISNNGWNLILLNKNNILPDNYQVNLKEIAGSSIKIDADAADFYNKMYMEATKEGIILTPFSGYRTVSFQRKLFENKIEDILEGIPAYEENREKNAVNEAVKSVNIPASSEHNAGLSVDIVSRDNSFSETDEYKWLCENAHKYGFILRYPEGKVKSTGVDFKPYHWRFVGINAAKEMKKTGQCLEEYLKLK